MTLRNWLERLDERMAKLDDRLDRVESNLAEHMRRTEVAEKQLQLVQSELRPLKEHVAMWAGAGKVLVVAGALVGLAAGIMQLVR